MIIYREKGECIRAVARSLNISINKSRRIYAGLYRKVHSSDKELEQNPEFRARAAEIMMKTIAYSIDRVIEELELLHYNELVIHGFAGNTPISMEDGSYKNISDVEIGDKILAFNEEALSYKKDNAKFYDINNIIVTTVTEVERYEAEAVKVKWDIPGVYDEFWLAGNQLFLSPDREFHLLYDISESDICNWGYVLYRPESCRSMTAVHNFELAISDETRIQTIYNLKTEAHTYIASDLIVRDQGGDIMENQDNIVVMDGQGNIVDVPITDERIGREYNLALRYDYKIIKTLQNTPIIIYRNERNPVPFKTLRGFAKIVKEHYPELSMKKCMRTMLRIYSKYGLCFKFQIMFDQIILITGYNLEDSGLRDRFVETDYIPINNFFK